MKTVFIFLIVFSALFLLRLPMAEAITGEEEFQAQILRIRAQIAELEKQLIELQLKSEGWCHDFLVNLEFNKKSPEVGALQIALGKEGLFKRSATSYFGPLTLQSVKLFQEKYKEEILFPLKLKNGTGFAAEATRSKLNELYGCSRVFISSLKPEQGDTLIVKVKTDSSQIEGKLKSEEIKFFKLKQNWTGILGISVKEKPEKYDLVVNFPEGVFLKKQIEILERKFPVTELLITKELEEEGLTASKIEENVAKENQKVSRALQASALSPYFKEPFVYPLKENKVVGDFGNIRKSGQIALQHLGVDLEADIGAPVYAVSDGIIRFSEELANYGKTLIIDHGLGIFSLYLHLNEFKASEGQEVKQEEVIALSGNTGYSISPHLHFSVKINGLSIDPLRFIETTRKSLLDK